MIAKQITLFLLAIVLNLSLNAAYAVEQTSVGTVTLVIGQTQAINKMGEPRILKRTDAIFVGDTIETNKSAHLHIKFIDDGRISIRPESRLHIEAYQYNQVSPEKSAIRFFLEQGVLRSISGKATEAAHDRYRMNTPVAALGVLGTDYVVRTSDTQTLAAVYSGGIALSPINYGCTNSGFGVCSSATVLTADMGSLYLEVNLGENQSRLKNQSESVSKTLINNSKESENTSSAVSKENNKEETRADTKGDTLNAKNSETRLTKPASNATDTDLASNAKLGASPETPSPVSEPVGPMPHLIPALESKEPVFTWARWTKGQHPDDTLSQSQRQVTKDKKITVGNQYVGLFRNTGSIADQRPQTGIFNFNLQQSHVVFIRPGETWQSAETATLNKAALQIDFGKQQVTTNLEMSTPTISATQLNTTGNINDKGLFIGSNNNETISGAISSTGNEVGMIFEKPLANGTFNGISEWQKQ
ncbi:MAG: hypothetical protein methR_PLP0028 (plasmid) [Methyloprofundus sp.]|nr:MAG: hypothetical protein methR_PLP0028 [Methyloprofundus sp.]